MDKNKEIEQLRRETIKPLFEFVKEVMENKTTSTARTEVLPEIVKVLLDNTYR